jgi:hypothetical protein
VSVEFSYFVVLQLDRDSAFSGGSFGGLRILFILLRLRALSLLAHLNIELIALNLAFLLVTVGLRHV